MLQETPQETPQELLQETPQEHHAASLVQLPYATIQRVIGRYLMRNEETAVQMVLNPAVSCLGKD
jgi:hypothetical protein